MRKMKSEGHAVVLIIHTGDLLQCSLASCLCSQVSIQRTSRTQRPACVSAAIATYTG